MYQRRFSSLSTLRMTGALVLMLALLAAPVGVSADQHEDEDGDMGDCVMALDIGEEGDACINVVHASPDAPAVDVYLDGDVALEGLAFGEASEWVNVAAGDYQMQVVPEGEDVDGAVIDEEVSPSEGGAYHIAAVGLVDEIAAEIFPADLSELDDDTARVTVIHASPDAPAIDIAETDGDVLVEDLEFPMASEALELPADTYDLEVRPTGEEDVVLELAGIELEDGMAYDVFAVGLVEDDTLEALLVGSDTDDADEMNDNDD